MGNAGHCTCGCGCLHGLRCADLQSSEEEPRQKGVGCHRDCCICGRDSGGHSDRPDTDAPLIGRGLNNTPPEILVSVGCVTLNQLVFGNVLMQACPLRAFLWRWLFKFALCKIILNKFDWVIWQGLSTLFELSDAYCLSDFLLP